jgi:hypothetical protein
VTLRWLRALALTPLTVVAATAGPVLAQSGWELRITPYAWLADVEGDVGPVSGRSLREVSLDFDGLDSLGQSGVIFASARRGSFVVHADLTSLGITSATEVAAARMAGLNVDTSATSFGLAVGRTISASEAHRVDVFAGMRAWWVSNDFSLDSGEPAPGGADANWVDPVVGLAARADLTDRLGLIGVAGIGGFGMAADSELHLLGGLAYAFSDRFGVSAAWRHLSVDYDRGGFLYDVDLSGPVLGATFRF